MQMADYITRCVCYRCGKEFYPEKLDNWVYKRYAYKVERAGCEKRRYFCSWGCMRAYDREYIPPVPNRRRKKHAERV